MGMSDRILDGELNVATPAGYNIYTALRGPDIQKLICLKVVLVLPLRRLVGASARTFQEGSSLLDIIDAAKKEWRRFRDWVDGMEDREVQLCLQRAFEHWANHLSFAYRSLIEIKHTQELELLFAIARALCFDDGFDCSVAGGLDAYAEYVREQDGHC